MAGIATFAIMSVLALLPKRVDIFGATVIGMLTAIGGDTLRDLHGRSAYLLGFEDGSASEIISGHIKKEPTKNPIAPMKVKRIDTLKSVSVSAACRGTKAKQAEIIKAIQPIKLALVTHHDISRGRNAQRR